VAGVNEREEENEREDEAPKGHGNGRGWEEERKGKGAAPSVTAGRPQEGGGPFWEFSVSTMGVVGAEPVSWERGTIAPRWGSSAAGR